MTDAPTRRASRGPALYRTVGERVEPEDAAGAGDLDERDALLVAGLEADRGARGHVQAHAEREGTIEPEGSIHFEKVEVRPDLYRPVASVRHGQLDRPAPRIRHDVAFAQQVFTRNHMGPPPRSLS